MREFIHLTKALADLNRVRILLALHRRELCVCQIVELFELAPSTISKHLSVLSHAGLVIPRKTERWVFYRLPAGKEPVAVREAIDWVQHSLEHSPEAQVDRKKLLRILKLSPTAVCRRQGKRC
jgi:DNA-binding transcriptional ArsR family regulator